MRGSGGMCVHREAERHRHRDTDRQRDRDIERHTHLLHTEVYAVVVARAVGDATRGAHSVAQAAREKITELVLRVVGQACG